MIRDVCRNYLCVCVCVCMCVCVCGREVSQLGVVGIHGIHKNLVNWDNYGTPLSIFEHK